MTTDDPARLREALDQIANALQPARIVASQLQRSSAATARDAAVVDSALTRVMAILKGPCNETCRNDQRSCPH